MSKIPAYACDDCGAIYTVRRPTFADPPRREYWYAQDNRHYCGPCVVAGYCTSCEVWYSAPCRLHPQGVLSDVR
jgi:hypothetical protein